MLNLIIPCYHSRDTLPALLDSLVAQTYKMFLVTIVNDCDGEDYTDLKERYEERGLHITLLSTPKNGGPGVARQYGIDHCGNCEYIMFADADDMLLPNTIETLYHNAKRTGADIIQSNFLREYADHHCDVMEVGKMGVTWVHGKVYRVGYLRDNGIRFLEELPLNEDAYFNLVAVNCAKNKYTLNEITYFWRHNQNSVTRTGNFFNKSWEGYILSQVRGIQKIFEIQGYMRVETLAATLNNIYGHCMRATYENKDMTLANLYIAELRNVEGIKEHIADVSFWSWIHDNLKPCTLTKEGVLIFYKKRFTDWLYGDVMGEINENSNS